jgi:hypothetical protein
MHGFAIELMIRSKGIPHRSCVCKRSNGASVPFSDAKSALVKGPLASCGLLGLLVLSGFVDGLFTSIKRSTVSTVSNHHNTQ